MIIVRGNHHDRRGIIAIDALVKPDKINPVQRFIGTAWRIGEFLFPVFAKGLQAREEELLGYVGARRGSSLRARATAIHVVMRQDAQMVERAFAIGRNALRD